MNTRSHGWIQAAIKAPRNYLEKSYLNQEKQVKVAKDHKCMELLKKVMRCSKMASLVAKTFAIGVDDAKKFVLKSYRYPLSYSNGKNIKLMIAATHANAASGIAVDDECKLKFLELKAKWNYRYIVFKIDESAQRVTVEKLGEPGDSYDDFAACMPEDECRYAVFDFDFVTVENCQKNKIIFVAW